MNVDLLRLLAVLGRINPAIWDVIFPQGPDRVSVSKATPGLKVELNPQPIPPGHGLQFASARVAGEIAQAAIAAEAAGSETGQRIVSRAVDEWCGTPPPKHWPFPWPGPWPFPWSPREREAEFDVQASQVVGALALGSIASRMSGGEVRDALASGAGQLLQAGME